MRGYFDDALFGRAKGLAQHYGAHRLTDAIESTPDTARADAEPRRIKSVEVGFRTIRILEAAGGFIPLARVAALAGMPSSKAYIYLASFIREGLVRQDPLTGHYGLGPFSVQLGLAAIRSLDVVSVGRDVVDSLRDKTGCGVSLAIWGNCGPSVMLVADGDGQGALGLRLGHVFRPTSSASGRVFLAFLPERETAEAVALEERTRRRGGGVDKELAAVLDRTRRDGYATSKQPGVTGRTAIAAPVFDFSGKVTAALAILADDTRPGSSALAALVASAEEVSRRLGHPVT